MRIFAISMEQVNQYVKQFPQLMKGKKVLYVHGFGSSGQSGTVARLRQVLPGAEVIAPDLPVHPQEAMDLLNNVCREEQPDLIIGTSMGGMYAEMLRGYDRILVNPALEMGETMKAHGMTGTQHFQNPRQDGVQEFIVTKALVKEYKEMTEHCFEGADTAEEQQHVVGLFGDEDTTVNTYDLFRTHYRTAIRFHGEHRMNDRSFMHAVVPVIRWIADRQEQRQRPIIYIDVNALIDQRQLQIAAEGAQATAPVTTAQPLGSLSTKVPPASSAQKTLRTLLESYQLYFVAPATDDPSAYAAMLSWLYEYVNVPAYGHTVFTNQKELLYGDYLIDPEKTEGMATLIQFGTDTFKTWDDVAQYFERLGGQ